MVGVNGSGKTTTIGKLAAKFTAQGRSVMLAAGDTFRAAAIEQLKVWGERAGAPGHRPRAGRRRRRPRLRRPRRRPRRRAPTSSSIDTAGRLQNKAGLMAELEKIVRVIRKIDAGGARTRCCSSSTPPSARTRSARSSCSRKAAGVTGLVMTKLDGTARGGILVALAAKFGLPVHFIGVGEGVEDLEPFAARDFARAIAGLDE